MRRAMVVVAVSLGGLSIPAILWLRRGAARPAAAAAVRTDENEVAQVRAEIADLRERVAATNRIAVSAVQVAENEHAVPSEAAAVEPPADPTPSKVALSDEEMRARLSNKFNGEPRDPAWGRPALSLLDGHIRAGLPAGSHITSIECRRTMCRVEAQHKDLEVYQRFVNEALLFPQGGWKGPVMTQIVNPGSEQVASIAYLLREGEEFAPILDQ